MLRKFLVWASCILIDWLYVYLKPENSRWDLFLKIHLAATVVMFVCIIVSFLFDIIFIGIINYDEREDEVCCSADDIVCVAILLVVSMTVGHFLGISKYICYITSTFLFCCADTTESKE